MARKAKKSEANYKEFSYEGKEFKYSGRLYPDSQKETKKCTITPMSLTLNDVLTIKGCRLMQTDKNAWIAYPSWEDKNKEYQSYIYVDKEFSQEAAEKVLDA